MAILEPEMYLLLIVKRFSSPDFSIISNWASLAKLGMHLPYTIPQTCFWGFFEFRILGPPVPPPPPPDLQYLVLGLQRQWECLYIGFRWCWIHIRYQFWNSTIRGPPTDPLKLGIPPKYMLYMDIWVFDGAEFIFGISFEIWQLGAPMQPPKILSPPPPKKNSLFPKKV